MQNAGMPSQCAWSELRTLPRNNQEMECPKPQPGHQVIPIALSGQRLKCTGPAGFANASETRAATQNTSSKYFEKNRLLRIL
ncbi:MAG: hypothetical protein JWR54_1178 [Mucilaginibacter sp.]|nr:hypothetical protein [Mucilaginibacter sp.]